MNTKQTNQTETDMTTQQMTANLEVLINAVMIAYYGQKAPCEKAWAHACTIVDRIKGGRKVSYTKVWDALEWLVEATKHDPKVKVGA